MNLNTFYLIFKQIGTEKMLKDSEQLLPKKKQIFFIKYILFQVISFTFPFC